MKVVANGNEYIIIVALDVNGDGKLTDQDIEKMINHYFGTEKLEGIYLEAGDCDNNNEITLKDRKLIQR